MKVYAVSYTHTEDYKYGVCEQCVPKAQTHMKVGCIRQNMGVEFCHECNRMLAEKEDILNENKQKDAALNSLVGEVCRIQRFSELVQKMQEGVPCKIQYTRKWVVAVPVKFTVDNNKLPCVRLLILARNPVKRWGDDFFYYSRSKMPDSVEPFPMDELPTLMGKNSTDVLEDFLSKGSLYG